MNRREDLGVETVYAPPVSAMEMALVSAWKEVLSLDRIGVHDDFFELGGDSLAMMQVIFRIAKISSIDVPIDTFFDGPTVQQLAAVVEAPERPTPTHARERNDLADGWSVSDVRRGT
jgi:acyl carrier protein